MNAMTRLYHRLKAVLQRRQLEQDLQEELNSHLEMDKQERIQRGESPEEAHYSARRDFGGSIRPAEGVREAWGVANVERIAQDLRYALRQMKRSPAFVAVAILTLGLGIGANTAIFSIVHAILLKPLPYRNSDRLVRIVENIPASESLTGAPQRTTNMSVDDFQEWRSRTTTLSGMALEMPVSMTLRGPEAMRLSGWRVSPSLFSLLEVPPLLGRLFEPAEEKPGSDRVLILSYAAWRGRFGGDPQILGRALTLDDAAYSVVGIMPREFAFPDSLAEFWTPLALTPPQAGRFIRLGVTARVKDGISMAAAAAEANTIGRELRGEPPGEASPAGPARIELMSWKDELVASIRHPLLVFVIAVAFVLLVACINVANLFLARGTTRHREIAIRMALGAGRARVLRQLLTENCLLAFLGGASGIVMASGGTRLFIAVGQGLARADLMRFEAAGNAIPRLNEVGTDGSVLLFTIALTIVAGVLFGIVPAIHAGRVNPMHTADPRTAGASTPALRFLRKVMVVGQISLTMILLLGAGLLIKSFMKLANTNLGYDPTNVLTFRIPQPGLSYPQDEAKQEQQNAFAEEVVTRLGSLPDIQAAAFTNGLPMVEAKFILLLKGKPRSAATPVRAGQIAAVSRDYFRAMGIRVIAGRGFDEGDRVSPRPVFVINRAAAKEYFPGSSPIGQTIAGAGFGPGEIVGIADDIRQSGLDAEPEPQVFLDVEHMDAVYGTGYYFVVRTTKDAADVVPAIRSIVRSIDATVVVDDIATMNQILSNSIAAPRSYAALLGTFSAATLVLAAIGLYGVLAYFVSQRRHEIGIRIALGAESWEVVLLVLRQGIALTFCGVALGLAGGAALTRYLEKMLFGITATDQTTFVIVSVLFIVVSLAACYLPARRATKIDPLIALRCD